MEAVINNSKVVLSGEGTKYNIMGHQVTVKFHSSEVYDHFIFELVSPPGASIPPHVHSLEDEFIYLIDGEFEVTVGEEVFMARAGDQLNFIRNIPHAYTNTGTIPTKSIWFVNPGKNMEDFFNELKLYPPGPPDMVRLTKLTQEHGQRFLI